jgi:hypothetical protein
MPSRQPGLRITTSGCIREVGGRVTQSGAALLQLRTPLGREGDYLAVALFPTRHQVLVRELGSRGKGRSPLGCQALPGRTLIEVMI